MSSPSLFLIILFALSCNKSGTSKSNKTSTLEIPIEGVEDPLVIHAWHLENLGQSTFSKAGGTMGEDHNIKEVHDIGVRGQGIKIAVSDSGVDISHADLSGNQMSGSHRDYSKNDSSTWRNGSPRPTEGSAHGTAMAGLISARGWNGIGSRGVAPLSRYAGFLFVGSFHSSVSSYEAKKLDQLTGNFDIFNYSYGLDGCSFEPANTDVISAYKSGVTTLRSGKGAIYVKSSGNEYLSLNSNCYPNDPSYFWGNANTNEEDNHPYLILVGAVNAKGVISPYSSPGSGVWITAAGGEWGDDNPAMLSTDILGCSSGYSKTSSTLSDFNKGSSPLNPYCHYTSKANGTSSATAVVSGIVALMLTANPNLTWRDVKHILVLTADRVDNSEDILLHPGGSSSYLTDHIYDYKWVKNGAGVYFSNKYGFGRANAESAVGMAKNYSATLGPYLESDYYSSGDFALSIPDNSSAGVTDSITVTENYFIESVQIKLSTNHEFIGDLGVELTSPSGTKSKILLINSNIKNTGLSDYTLISNAFYNEMSQGEWTIKLIDGALNDVGDITNWKIKVSGHQ
jgi:subtilisin family serine protease